MQPFFLYTCVLLCSYAFGVHGSVKRLCPRKLVKATSMDYLRTYKNKCYVFVYDKPLYYDFAQGVCEKNNGTLAMPKTKDVNDFLVEEMKSLTASRYSTPVWIGMTDREAEGEMVWEDGTQVEWDNFDPSTKGVSGYWEDCVALDLESYTWHDYRCSNGVFNTPKLFVCEYSVAPKNAGKKKRCKYFKCDREFVYRYDD